MKDLHPRMAKRVEGLYNDLDLMAYKITSDKGCKDLQIRRSMSTNFALLTLFP